MAAMELTNHPTVTGVYEPSADRSDSGDNLESAILAPRVEEAVMQ